MPKRRTTRGTESTAVSRKRIRRQDIQSEESDDEIRPANLSNSHRTASQDVDDSQEPQREDVDLDSEREEDDDDEDEEEDDEDVASQVRLSCENGFSHSGILHSVRLDRFMSHRCFEYHLGQNVNIVNGPNGSGKSAIVAALQIALGARPSSTERAAKIEEHIMHGESNAIITIKILNRKPPVTEDNMSEPDLTFRHDVYGDYIIVEKRLARSKESSKSSGSSAIIMKGKGGRIVQHEKPHSHAKELRLVIDHFGFMVENPVAILTQTKSKAFLAKGKPAQHYKLYREATLLAPLEDELDRTREVTRVVEAKLRNFEEGAPSAKKNLDALEAEFQESLEMKNIDVRIRDAELRFAWTVVQESERKVEEVKATLKDELEPDAERARLALEKSAKKLENLRSQVTQHNNAVNEATEKSRIATTSSRDIQKKLRQAEHDLDRHKRRVNEFESEMADLEERIRRTEARKEQARKAHFAGQEQKSRLVQEMQDIDERVAEVKEEIKSWKEKDATLHEQKYAVEEEKRKAMDDCQKFSQEFENKRRQHMQAANSMRKNDNLARFGHGMPEMLHRIKLNERGFHRLPIGPLGQFVKLRDDSWAPAIELALGRQSLLTFLVHDSHDASLLQSIMPREGPKPSMLISNLDRDRYVIRPNDMPDVAAYGHKTILETIDIQHHVVFNALVDQSHIENVVLNGRNEDITELGWSRIPNLHTVWNKQCERAYTRNGSNTFRKAPRNTTAHILTTDMRPYVESLKREADAMEAEMRRSSEHARSCDAKLRKLINEAASGHQAIRAGERQIVELQRRKAEVEDQLGRAENAFDPTPFDSEVSSREEEIGAQSAQRSTALSEVQRIEGSMGVLQQEAEEAKTVVQKAAAVTSDAVKVLRALNDDIAKLASRDRQLRKDSEKLNAVLRTAHADLQALTLEVTKYMESAMEFGTCPDDINPDVQTSEQLNREVTTLKHRLEAEQERRGGRSAADIEASYLLAKKKDQENQMIYNRILFYKQALQRGIVNRKDLLKKLNVFLKRMVRSNFKRFLGTRGHTGNISFKTEGGVKQLCITTKMASHKRGDGELYETKDLRSLSGGERSYTTLAFMLALAEVCQNPIRVMDEIDVFQDEANRRASFKTIIDFCTQYLSNRQFIIITPLSLPNVEACPAVRISRLDPPRPESGGRRQTRIDQYTTTEQ